MPAPGIDNPKRPIASRQKFAASCSPNRFLDRDFMRSLLFSQHSLILFTTFIQYFFCLLFSFNCPFSPLLWQLRLSLCYFDHSNCYIRIPNSRVATTRSFSLSLTSCQLQWPRGVRVGCWTSYRDSRLQPVQLMNSCNSSRIRSRHRYVGGRTRGRGFVSNVCYRYNQMPLLHRSQLPSSSQLS